MGQAQRGCSGVCRPENSDSAQIGVNNMNSVRDRFAAVAAALLLASLGSTAASAANYSFEVLYFGNNVATLAAGSDDPVGATFSAGDSFTYTLTGQNGFFESNAGAIFPFIALAVDEQGRRISDFSLTLSNMGTTVFSFAETNAVNEEVHLGANEVVLPGGLVFDRITLQNTVLSAEDLLGDPVTTTVNSILPIFGSPDQNRFYPGVVTYSLNAVPEPATWAMMVGGFGMLGGMARRRVRTAVTYAYVTTRLG